MTLAQWAENGWLREHRATREEIRNLLAIAERDIQDATGGVSSDWQFGIAYNAALKLCTVLLNASGYRAERSLLDWDAEWDPLTLSAAFAGSAGIIGAEDMNHGQAVGGVLLRNPFEDSPVLTLID